MKNFYHLTMAFMLVLLGCSKNTPESVAPPLHELSSEKNITEFKFLKSINSSLDKDYVGTIVNNTISLNFTRGIDISNLKASFQVSAKSNLKIANSIQENGVTQ